MICPKCNNPVEDGSLFCGICGQRIVEQNDLQKQQTAIPETKQKQIKISKKNIKYIAIVVVAIIVLSVACGIIKGIANSKVDLKDYVNENIVYVGANGYGSVSEDSLSDFINYEDLVSDIYIEGYYNDYWGSVSDDSITDYFEINAPINNGKLSNGDSIEITVKIDKDRMKKNKNIIKNISGGNELTFKYEVSELPECISIDIFDAIESYNYDMTTSYYNNLYIKYKTDYVKTYENGIEVRVIDNEFVVYGDDFYSFEMSAGPRTDNIHPDTATVELYVDCEDTDYLEYGLIFAPSSKQFPLSKITYISENAFTTEDITYLTNKANEKAATSLEPTAVLDNIKFYVYNEGDNSIETMLVYFYKNGEVYNAIIYTDLKQINGVVYDIANVEPEVRAGWLGGVYEYFFIEEFENEIVFTQKYDVVVN